MFEVQIENLDIGSHLVKFLQEASFLLYLFTNCVSVGPSYLELSFLSATADLVLWMTCFGQSEDLFADINFYVVSILDAKFIQMSNPFVQ